MAAHILLTLTPLILSLLLPLTSAQSAPAPAPSGPVNLTGILDKNGQYTTFIKLLVSTQVATQIQNQINSSTEGMTIFAPTDNAFNNLKAGQLNSLGNQQQVQLVLYHITPKFYKLNDLLLVSNPVRTQAAGQEGGVWGLNFTGQGNQVNVSSGVVETQINNALRQDFPLAVYQVDKVLLPNELFGAKSPSAAPAPTVKKPSEDSNTTLSSAKEPSTADDSSSSGKINNAGLGLIAGLALLCMGALS
ncbi:Fasciclin-like arabinogalactan protein [Melia azedarach]|uniref:Fasciclin-like arabinogalactan protein n=2 Tax=Melia azedarach TaxID=155640 RepID=A0ACC1Z174_MELAZ|nr:Fasciclin-like arabinogalactan protein [Melia azedarach]KAJ4729726.1 Fasciclin-like arabinogalactan protein [Melia azedarach]